MRLEQVVVQILVNSKKAKNEESALQLIKAAFHQTLPSQNYDSWNIEIEDSVAKNLIENARQRDKIILSILIQDLYTIARRLLAIGSLYLISRGGL